MEKEARLDVNMPLIEELHQRLKTAYLSDLRMPEHRERLLAVLETLEASSYSVTEWRECWRYLLDNNPRRNLLPRQLAEGIQAALRQCAPDRRS